MGGGWFIMGDVKFLKSLYIVGRRVLNPLFYEDDLPYISKSPFFKFFPPPPPLPFSTFLSPPTLNATALSVIIFLWINEWSRHIWYTILLNDNMDLQMSSLPTLVPEGPWFVFYATRQQFYWGMTHNVVFY